MIGGCVIFRYTLYMTFNSIRHEVTPAPQAAEPVVNQIQLFTHMVEDALSVDKATATDKERLEAALVVIKTIPDTDENKSLLRAAQIFIKHHQDEVEAEPLPPTLH